MIFVFVEMNKRAGRVLLFLCFRQSAEAQNTVSTYGYSSVTDSDVKNKWQCWSNVLLYRKMHVQTTEVQDLKSNFIENILIFRSNRPFMWQFRARNFSNRALYNMTQISISYEHFPLT